MPIPPGTSPFGFGCPIVIHEDSVVSALSTSLGTSEESAISPFVTIGTREDPVISACGTP